MKINPKLERSNCKTLEFQESPSILQYYPAEQIVAGHQLDHEIKFLLVSVLFFDFTTYRHNTMGKQTEKSTLSPLPWYLRLYNHTWPSHSWPTAPQPAPWKERHTRYYESYINREKTGVPLGCPSLLYHLHPNDLASYRFPEGHEQITQHKEFSEYAESVQQELLIWGSADNMWV